jgi:hypothetical protein
VDPLDITGLIPNRVVYPIKARRDLTKGASRTSCVNLKSRQRAHTALLVEFLSRIRNVDVPYFVSLGRPYGEFIEKGGPDLPYKSNRFVVLIRARFAGFLRHRNCVLPPFYNPVLSALQARD